ncbi:MAG: hypothetical protein FD123_2452 [Bacteroidetes bacterium]|nr:MAG: hypothetical protein FD123_2452 [Bacteroidota bacterium]
MKFCRLALPACLFALFIQACTPLYMSDRPPAHFLAGKNQGNITAGFGSSGFEAKAAFSPVNHLAVEASFSGFSQDESRYNLKEAGIGGYYCFNKLYLLELNLGYGAGAAENRERNFFNTYLQKGSFTRMWIRPSASIILEKTELALGCRYASVVMDYTNYDNPSVPFRNESDVRYWEPFFVLRTGGEKIKGFVEGSYIHTGSRTDYSFSPFYFGAGFSYHPGRTSGQSTQIKR